jgi:hypothetical protein
MSTSTSRLRRCAAGMSLNIENPTAFLRGNYLNMLGSYKFGDAGSALPTFQSCTFVWNTMAGFPMGGPVIVLGAR